MRRWLVREQALVLYNAKNVAEKAGTLYIVSGCRRHRGGNLAGVHPCISDMRARLPNAAPFT